MGQLQSAYVTSQRLVLLLQGTPNATGPYTGGPFAWIDFVEDIPPHAFVLKHVDPLRPQHQQRSLSVGRGLSTAPEASFARAIAELASCVPHTSAF
jgi:hypothetical protein